MHLLLIIISFLVSMFSGVVQILTQVLVIFVQIFDIMFIVCLVVYPLALNMLTDCIPF